MGSSPSVGATRIGPLEKWLNSYAFHAYTHGFESRTGHHKNPASPTGGAGFFVLPHPCGSRQRATNSTDSCLPLSREVARRQPRRRESANGDSLHRSGGAAISPSVCFADSSLVRGSQGCGGWRRSRARCRGGIKKTPPAGPRSPPGRHPTTNLFTKPAAKTIRKIARKKFLTPHLTSQDAGSRLGNRSIHTMFHPFIVFG